MKKMFSITRVTWEDQEEIIETLEANLVADSYYEVNKYVEENYKGFDGKWNFVCEDQALARLYDGQSYIEIFVWPAQDTQEETEEQ